MEKAWGAATKEEIKSENNKKLDRKIVVTFGKRKLVK